MDVTPSSVDRGTGDEAIDRDVESENWGRRYGLWRTNMQSIATANENSATRERKISIGWQGFHGGAVFAEKKHFRLYDFNGPLVRICQNVG